jgi:hypothetical protein
MTQTKFGAACRSEIKTFYSVRLSQPLLEILIFLGIVYISNLNVFRRVRSRVNPMKDSSHVDRFVTTYRGSTCELRAEAATLRDADMARNRFFYCLLLYWNHKWVQDQQIQTSITSMFIEIFRIHFSGACTWTVSNVLQNYNSLGSWVGGKMGVRKKKFSKKKFFPCNFSASFST